MLVLRWQLLGHCACRPRISLGEILVDHHICQDRRGLPMSLAVSHQIRLHETARTHIHDDCRSLGNAIAHVFIFLAIGVCHCIGRSDLPHLHVLPEESPTSKWRDGAPYMIQISPVTSAR